MKDDQKKIKTPADFPGELCISGTVLGRQHESRQYKDKQTGQERTLELEVVFLQSDIGVCVVRAFNPEMDMSDFKAGDQVCFPVERFEKDNGVKSFGVRV